MDDSTTHPDEGMIHAWLDGALDAPTAAGIAEHVRTCPACTERVAEARGLIAGASRIVASLDEAAVGTRPGWAQSAPERSSAPVAAAVTAQSQGSLWRWLHVTPARAAIAATILVGLGITFTRSRSGPDDIRVASKTGDLSAPAAVMTDSGGAVAAAAPMEARDPLLDSAIKKNLAIAQPPRALDAARSPGVPVPAAREPAIGLAEADTTASARVAAGRGEITAQREQAAGLADKTNIRGRVAGAPASPTTVSQLGKAEASAAVVSAYGDAGMASKSANAGATQCYVIESPEAGARWGGEPLPLVVRVDSSVRAGSTTAQVLTAAGQPTSVRAQLLPGSADSLTLRLRRVGYSGAIALGPDLGGRAGLASSGPSSAALEAVVPTRVGGTRRDAASGSAVERKAASAAPSAPSANAPAPAPARANTTRVTMRPVNCPTR